MIERTGDGRVHYRRHRARAIDAPPAAVWPWLVQMGYDRGGWYAVDVLEKAFGVGRFATGWSARRVEPDLQDLAVGDRMPLTATRWLDVTVLDAPRELELVMPPGLLTWTWRFTLDPLDQDRTLLTITTELSVRARCAPARLVARIAFAAFDVGHGLMERVQLRTLARRIPSGRSPDPSG
jgi:hypothetical protein